MTIVHNKPNSNQKEELLFQKYLLSKLSEYTHINKTYKLSEKEFINPHVDVRKIEKSLLNVNYLSTKKKDLVLNVLSILPGKIKAAEKHHLVSVDFVLIKNNIKHYLEFHEKQHRNLSVSRPTYVYDENNNRYEIPRFVQRLLKDVWRFENLGNYNIIWFDWFEQNPNFKVDEFLSLGKYEFKIENRFSFLELLR